MRLFYDRNPGSFAVNLHYNFIDNLDKKQHDDNRDVFTDKYLGTTALTMTAEYSNGQSERLDISIQQLLNTETGRGAFFHLKNPAPAGNLKYTFQFNPTMVEEMPLYYYLWVEPIKSVPQNISITRYIDFLRHTPVFFYIFFVLAVVSWPLMMIGLANLNKGRSPGWWNVISNWLFSPYIIILTSLMIAHMLFIVMLFDFAILLNAMGLMLVRYFFFCVFLFFSPLIFSVISALLAPWLYKKFAAGTPEQCKLMFEISIPISAAWGILIACILFVSLFG